LDDPEEIFEIGIEHAVGQCKDLMDKVPCIHFYTMDSWEATDRIIGELI
jgi:5,10-methylenetetrahydrofolate reductase